MLPGFLLVYSGSFRGQLGLPVIDLHPSFYCDQLTLIAAVREYESRVFCES